MIIMNAKCKICNRYYEEKEDYQVEYCNHCDYYSISSIYNKQLGLQKRLGYSKNELVLNQKFININILALLDELTEALRETQWKNPKVIKYGWKKTQKFNQENFKNELIDILHFFINLCIASGMEPEEIFNRYFDKNKINFKRQDVGY